MFDNYWVTNKCLWLFPKEGIWTFYTLSQSKFQCDVSAAFNPVLVHVYMHSACIPQYFAHKHPSLEP